MSSESLAAWEASKAEKAEKEKVEAEKAAAKVEAEKENEERRGRLVHDTEVRYRGSLKSKNKVDLQDISTLLGISFTSKTTNVDLAKAIIKQLAGKPELEMDPRYEGLYSNIPHAAAPVDLPVTPLATLSPLSQPLSSSTSHRFQPYPGGIRNSSSMQCPDRIHPCPLFVQGSSSQLLEANSENNAPGTLSTPLHHKSFTTASRGPPFSFVTNELDSANSQLYPGNQSYFATHQHLL